MLPLSEHESGQIRYANSGGVSVAYQVSGSGPVDLVYVGGWITHIEAAREDPGIARFQDSLRRFSRVVDFDKRGTGLSDRVPDAQLPTMEDRMLASLGPTRPRSDHRHATRDLICRRTSGRIY